MSFNLPHINSKAAVIVATSVIIAIFSTISPLFATASVQSPAPAARVSLTFDDGLASAYDKVAPILKSYGLTATDYVITGCVGMTKSPNKCHANTEAKYMTWQQIKDLQNKYGWEIGSHTATHPYLATKDASDGQPKVLSPAQVSQELASSKQTLAANGINARALSTPYGDYNNAVLAQIAKYYESHRGFADEGMNYWPNNDYLLYDYRVQAGVSVKQVTDKIDQAIASNQWLILTMHDIKDKPSQNPDDYEYATSQVSQIAKYIHGKQVLGKIKSVNVSQGLVKSDTNLLPNGSFNSGISGGWTTDSSTTFSKDAKTNGSYPDAVNSIAFKSSTTSEKHLFSPLINVGSLGSYVFKGFLNVSKLSSGGVGYYIDEYDANGNWISGQYKKLENSSFVENMNFVYKPTSVNISKVRVQIIARGTLSGFLDNLQFFPVTSSDSPNLFGASGNFDQGITGGWNTDRPEAITLDASSKGSPNNVVNSIKLTSSAAVSNHLFSPGIALSPNHSYDILSYLDIKQISSGEVGFYIDEFDSAGNWISGQYKTGVRSSGINMVGLRYQPSSARVSSASLQVIVTPNSGITAYFDDVQWYIAE